jgi:hypothetical protein
MRAKSTIWRKIHPLSVAQPTDNLPQISRILHNQQTKKSFVRARKCEAHSHAEQLLGIEACCTNGKKLFSRQQQYNKEMRRKLHNINCINATRALLNLNRP